MKIRNLLFILLLLIGCNKVELSEVEESQKPPAVSELNLPTMTVEQALQSIADITVTIEGYIVGYITGVSIPKGSKFDVPIDAPNTNFLLADDKHLQTTENAMAVKLEKTGKYATREELNLYDNPDYFQKKIKITGQLSKYFSKNGITRIYLYEFIEIEEEKNENFNDTIDITRNNTLKERKEITE